MDRKSKINYPSSFRLSLCSACSSDLYLYFFDNFRAFSSIGPIPGSLWIPVKLRIRITQSDFKYNLILVVQFRWTIEFIAKLKIGKSTVFAKQVLLLLFASIVLID